MKDISPKVRTIVTIIFLILGLKWSVLGLIGLNLMWFWTYWPKWVKFIVSIPFVLILLFSVLILVTLLLIRPVKVVGEAMAPNYKNNASYITTVVRKDNINFDRGDVVVYVTPEENGTQSIKRIIGLPNEKIMFKSGEVYINGQRLDETKYLTSDVKTYLGKYFKESKETVIPANMYVVLGDNRAHSSDSRIWGFLPQENILSKVSSCYWNCK